MCFRNAAFQTQVSVARLADGRYTGMSVFVLIGRQSLGLSVVQARAGLCIKLITQSKSVTFLFGGRRTV